MQVLCIKMLQPSGTDGGGHVTNNAAGALGHSSQRLVRSAEQHVPVRIAAVL